MTRKPRITLNSSKSNQHGVCAEIIVAIPDNKNSTWVISFKRKTKTNLLYIPSKAACPFSMTRKTLQKDQDFSNKNRSWEAMITSTRKSRCNPCIPQAPNHFLKETNQLILFNPFLIGSQRGRFVSMIIAKFWLDLSFWELKRKYIMLALLPTQLWEQLRRVHANNEKQQQLDSIVIFIK